MSSKNKRQSIGQSAVYDKGEVSGFQQHRPIMISSRCKVHQRILLLGVYRFAIIYLLSAILLTNGLTVETVHHHSHPRIQRVSSLTSRRTTAIFNTRLYSSYPPPPPGTPPPPSPNNSGRNTNYNYGGFNSNTGSNYNRDFGGSSTGSNSNRDFTPNSNTNNPGRSTDNNYGGFNSNTGSNYNRDFGSNTGSNKSFSSNPNTNPTTSFNSNNQRNSLVLYGHPGSRSPLVNWACYELDINDIRMGNLNDNPHPFGKIPCLTDLNGEIGIFESGAILQYLHDKYGQKHKSKLSVGQNAALASWIVWANASLEPICFIASDDGKLQATGLRRRNSQNLKDIDRLDEILGNVSKQQQQQRVPSTGSTGTSGSPSWDGPPRSTPTSTSSGPPRTSSSTPSAFLLGPDFTLADVAVASYLLFALRFYPDTDLSRWPNIVKYMYACASRDAYGKAYGKDVQHTLLELLRGMTGGRDLLLSSSKNSLVLYGHPSSTSPIVTWAGIEFSLDLIKGNLAKNPHPYGKIPCLTDQNGKIMVFEPGPILHYLQDHYEKNGQRKGGDAVSRNDSYRTDGRSMPQGTSAEVSEQVNSWIDWATISLEPLCLVGEVIDRRRLAPSERQVQSQQPRPERRGQLLGESQLQSKQLPADTRRKYMDFYARPGLDFEVLDELNHQLGQKQRQVEQRLQQPNQVSGGRTVNDAPPSSCFLVGDKFTLADVAVASLLLYIPQNFPGTDLSQWPYLVRYMQDCARRPGYADAFGRDIQAYVLDELNRSRRSGGPGLAGPSGMGPGGGSAPRGMRTDGRPGGPGGQRPQGGMGRGRYDDDDRGRNYAGRGLFTPAYRT